MSRIAIPVSQESDDAGNPLVSGQLHFFEVGTATLKNTFADADFTIKNANPVLLDGAGRTPNIYGSGAYRMTLSDSMGSQIWERDNVGSGESDAFGEEWDSTVTYVVPNVVLHDGRYYTSVVNNNVGNDPSTSAEWVSVDSSTVHTFNNIADMVASTRIFIGNTVNTRGYFASSDGGGATYVIVGPQSADEQGDHTLNGGNVAKISNSGLIDVRQYGATGDGVNNDLPALQAATDTTKDIRVVDGTYIITSAFNVKSSIVSNGAAIKRAPSTSFTNLLKLSSQNNITIENLIIDGDKATASGGFTNIQVENCGGVSFLGCKVINAVGHGLSVTNSDNISTINCTISDSGSDGIEIRSCSNTEISGCRVTGGRAGIVFSRDVNDNQVATIANNIISNCSKTGMSIPRDLGTSIPYTLDTTIVGNSVSFCGENGYLIQSARGTVSGNISKNNGTLTTHQGFVINGTDLAITGNTSEFNAGVGMDLGNADDCTVVGNYLRSNGIIGLEINSCSNIVASSNYIKSNYQSDPGFSHQVGLVVSGEGAQWPTIKSTRIKLSGNVVTSGPNQTHGIRVTNAENVTIDHNDCLTSGTVADLSIELLTENDYEAIGNRVNNPSLVVSAVLTIPANASAITIASGSGDVSTVNQLTTTPAFKHQEILLYFNTGATLKHATGNLFLSGGIDYAITTGRSISFININGDWKETSRT